MPKRTSDYHAGLRERLKDPHVAASYLRSAMQESRDLFFIALRNVAQARQMSKVAKHSALNRENLYRMLSSEGNPTYDSLNSVLKTVGLTLSVEPLPPTHPSSPPSSLRTSEIRQSPETSLKGKLMAKSVKVEEEVSKQPLRKMIDTQPGLKSGLPKSKKKLAHMIEPTSW